MMESSSQSQPQPQAPPSQPQAAANRAGGRWQGRYGNPASILIVGLVALLVLVDIGYNIYRVIYGLAPTISGEIFGLFGILVLVTVIRLADVTRTPETLSRYQVIPPLGLSTGSVRAILALLILGIWILLIVRGSSFIADGNQLDKVLTTVGSLLGAVVGFYFGSRAAQGK